ncbi:hypothetical protein P43SY_007951 [Pythium insidiosum]|uniref:PH domain-containing protein n=1 Tax=Pythium insidiosum TaxID=114742 RepID=A0AAD5LA46_PYTIN|nr:hypothetical protein P43SY_007951 [Pythium insidiosum]
MTTTSSLSPSTSLGIACESYLRIKKRGALTWSTKFLVLRGSQLVWFNSKLDAEWRRGALDIDCLQHGQLTTVRNELSLAMVTEDGKQYIARAFSRGDLARWITALQRLALKREGKLSAIRASEVPASSPDGQQPLEKNSTKPGRRQVSFHGSVMVRMIPTVDDDQISELFYTRKDMEKFSAQASSIFCRTEDAVSCAFLSLRGPATICRKEVA